MNDRTTIAVPARLFHAMRNLLLRARDGTMNEHIVTDAWILNAIDWDVDDVRALSDAAALCPGRIYPGRVARTFDLIGVTALSVARTVPDADLLCIGSFGTKALASWKAGLAAYDAKRAAGGDTPGVLL